MNCWVSASLSKIASTSGKLLFADECTTKRTRISYARMLIETNITKALPTKVTVMDPRGKQFQQKLVYEWCEHQSQSISQVETPKISQLKEGRVSEKPEMQQDKDKGVISPALKLINFPILSPYTSRNDMVDARRGRGKEVRNYLKANTIKLAGIVETRIKEHNASRTSSYIAHGWDVIQNYSHPINGRIWILWDSSYYTVTLIMTEAHIFQCLVKGPARNIDCYLTIVYGFNTIDQRKLLWDNLKEAAQGITKPWLIGGDFNSILYTQDKLCGCTVNNDEIRDYANCIQALRLTEMAWEG
ncbi:uncharacterized protein LOC142167787 [Nicotiana tabacum]|uniref:Uncharacterized protein LOC142167787 n=1 Tax=Nicotiana tabacum TaxID=4097 RepID=A0AC58SFN2_TOBAC